MKFFHIWADWESLRPDGEYWSIRSNEYLSDFTQQHYQGKLPRQNDLSQLPVTVYSDYPLGDALSKSGFYDCFFVSEKLKKLLDGLRLPANQVFFFEKKIQWRQTQHAFFWLHTLAPGDSDAFFDFEKSRFVKMGNPQSFQAASFKQLLEKSGRNINWAESEVWMTAEAGEFDLFRLPGANLGKALFCSERLKNEVEAVGTTGFSFADAPFLNVSVLRKTPQPSVSPQVFEMNFRESSRFSEGDEMDSSAAENSAEDWFEELFDFAQTEPEDRSSLLPFLKKQVRKALYAKQDWGKKSLTQPELEASPSTSRFMGKPFLPNNFVWPRTAEGHPLLFVGQINLEHLPANEDLPATGILSFFLDVYGSTDSWPMEAGRHHVCFFEETVNCALSDFPDDLPLNADFEALPLQFTPAFNLPDDRYTEIFSEEEMPEKEMYEPFLNEVCYEPVFSPGGSKLLGWPQCVQGYVGADATVWLDYKGDFEAYQEKEAEALVAARQWRLLFQCEAGQMGLEDQLSDAGFYFLIKEDDLRNRDFSRTALVVQAT